MIASNVADDILFAVPYELVRAVIKKMNASYKLSTIGFELGTFLFFGLTIQQ